MAMAVTDTVMLGWLGATELAASVLATQGFFILYIFGVGFAYAAMVPLGLASAATVRAGMACGRGEEADVGRARITALVMAGGFALTSEATFWIWPEDIIGLYLDPENANAPPR